MIQCNRCNLQYIGETKRRLKDRFNEHRRTIDNPNTKSKPTTAAEHFLSSPNHTANDMQLMTCNVSDGLTSYTFFSTGETRTIKSNLTCDTKNLIYMIQCNRCNLQYIGETKRRLKDRFNEHRRTIDNPNTKSKPTTAAEHFLSSPNHTANDMQLIPIEKNFL